MISAKMGESPMGGFGSGQWPRRQTKDTVDSYPRLDIRAWQRQRLLRPGSGFWWGHWTPEGRFVAALHVEVPDAAGLVLQHVGHAGEGGRSPATYVPLVWSPCPYGGRRPWFLCPGGGPGGCGQRVAVLYRAGTAARCRHCFGLAYASQRHDRPTRLIIRAQQTRRRLGGSGSLMEPFPPRPRGMHERTYRRLRRAAEAREAAGLHAQLAQLEGWHTRWLVSEDRRDE
jgi:hypothetical protein